MKKILLILLVMSMHLTHTAFFKKTKITPEIAFQMHMAESVLAQEFEKNHQYHNGFKAGYELGNKDKKNKLNNMFKLNPTLGPKDEIILKDIFNDQAIYTYFHKRNKSKQKKLTAQQRFQRHTSDGVQDYLKGFIQGYWLGFNKK